MFWKIFGTVVLAALVVGVVGGVIMRSVDFTYIMMQRTLVAAMGIFGLVGFGVIPVEMYLVDKSRRNKADVVK
jgi:hypothetical protein